MPRVPIRACSLLAILMAVSAGAGCSQSGSMRVSWEFSGGASTTGGCGQHGIDSILITGADTGGDSIRLVTACPPGWTTVDAPYGTWSVSLAMLNFDGAIIQPPSDAPDASGTTPVASDAPGAVLIQLTAAPACRDGVDNDADGRVDLADPDCQGNPEGTAE